jgi:hypothetical protein
MVGGDKENSRGGKFDIVIIFGNTTTYPFPAQQ